MDKRELFNKPEWTRSYGHQQMSLFKSTDFQILRVELRSFDTF